MCLYIHYLHFLYKIHRPFLPASSTALVRFKTVRVVWARRSGIFAHFERSFEVKVSARLSGSIHFRRKYRVHHGVRQECGRIVMNLFFEFHSIRLKVCILPCQREQDRYAGLDLIKTYLSYTVQ